MSEKMTHLKLPLSKWRDGDTLILDVDKMIVAECRSVGQLQEIVKSVNSHQALLDACKAAQMWFEVQSMAGGIPPTQGVTPQLEAAIKLAEGM
jgi:hypothetical protein